MRGGRTVVASAIVIGVLAGRAAAAPHIAARFVYDRGPGAESCPEAAEVRAAVVKRLGFDPFEDEADVTMICRVERDGDGPLRADIQMVADGRQVAARRQLASASADCAELAAAVALAIAIAVDPRRAEPPPPRERRVAAAAPWPPGDPPPEASAVGAGLVVPPERPRVRLFAGVGALAAVGAAPGATAGATLALGIRRGPVSLWLEGRADLPAAEDVADGEIRASLLVASAAPCAHAGQFALCAVVAGGELRSAGRGFPASREATTPYLGAGARLVWELPVAANFAFRIEFGALGAIARSTLLVDGEAVWTMPRVSAAAGLVAVGAFR